VICRLAREWTIPWWLLQLWLWARCAH